MESNDVNIIIESGQSSGIKIELQSVVIKQFGKQIRKVVENTIRENGIEDAIVYVIDRGAIDFVIKARTQTALYRVCGKPEGIWEV